MSSGRTSCSSFCYLSDADSKLSADQWDFETPDEWEDELTGNFSGKIEKVMENPENFPTEPVIFADTHPIQTSINGTWRLESSDNIEHFLLTMKVGDLEKFRWKHGLQHYNFNEMTQTLKSHTILFYENLLYRSNCFSVYENQVEKKEFNLEFTISDNKFITKKLGKSNGKVFSVIERFIENGKLIILNHRNDMTARRCYVRVSYD